MSHRSFVSVNIYCPPTKLWKNSDYVRLSVHSGGGAGVSHVTITHDALDLIVQGTPASSFPPDMGCHCTAPLAILETCSNLLLENPSMVLTSGGCGKEAGAAYATGILSCYILLLYGPEKP